MYPTPTDIVREIAYLNRQARKKGLVKDEFSSESHIVDTASTAVCQQHQWNRFRRDVELRARLSQLRP
jgi:hypothetical protein